MRRLFYILLFASLSFSSCRSDEPTYDDLYKEMESYVYNNEQDVYGFEEIRRFAQKTDKLYRDTDIYILQDYLSNAVNQRLAFVAHTYFVNSSWKSNNLNRTLFDIDGKDLKVCPNPEYADLYLTQEEIDYANMVYYSAIPNQLKTINEIESRKFDGFRYYYACKYRKKLSDRFITKEFVVYVNDKKYEIHELKYDYDLLRSYIRAISSVDMNDPYVVSICKKDYGLVSSEIYRNTARRLGIDILDDSAIRGY